MQSLKDSIKLSVGKSLLRLLPARGEQLAAAGFTLDIGEHLNPVDRLLRYAMLHETASAQDLDQLVEYHHNYWKDRGKEYYDIQSEWGVFEDYFRPNLAFIIDALAARLEERPEVTTLCEIGVGSGEVLAYCAEQMPQLTRLIGLDLNAPQVEANREKFPQPPFEFHAAEAAAWIEAHAGPNWVFLTSRGVLEYFTQPNLVAMFNFIATTCRPAQLVLIEPIGTGHDLATQIDSQFYGREFSFSHNYPHWLREAGFELWHESVLPVDEQHRLLIIGAEGG